MYKEEFLSIVQRADGRLSPKTLNELYFQKIDKQYLWDYYISSTQLFKDYPISDRIFFLINNITEIKYCKCCPNPCMTINYTAPKTYSNYCSQRCGQIDKEPRKNILSLIG